MLSAEITAELERIIDLAGQHKDKAVIAGEFNQAQVLREERDVARNGLAAIVRLSRLEPLPKT